MTIREFRINNPKSHVSPHTLWESLKCVIQGETIKYCAEKKKFNFKLEYLQSHNEKGNVFKYDIQNAI